MIPHFRLVPGSSIRRSGEDLDALEYKKRPLDASPNFEIAMKGHDNARDSEEN